MRADILKPVYQRRLHPILKISLKNRLLTKLITSRSIERFHSCYLPRHKIKRFASVPSGSLSASYLLRHIMGCTASKPTARPKAKSSPNTTSHSHYPPRKSTRPLHPSAHHPDALLSQHDAYISCSARDAVKKQQVRGKSKQNRSRKSDDPFSNRYSIRPRPQPPQPMYTIPRKPVPKRSTALATVPPPAKGSRGKGKPYTVVWQASDHSRFPPAPGPPPGRPIPLLPIAKPQQQYKPYQTVSRQTPTNHYTASTYSAFPPRPGPPPNRALPPLPVVSPLARNDRRQTTLSMYSLVSSLGPEPERVLPHIPRPGHMRGY